MRLFSLLAFLMLVILSVNAKAALQGAEDIAKIEGYLNGITTLVAPFEQEDSAGAVAKGTFYLERPGRLKWDYDPPTPILIVAKGSLVAYYDRELDQLSHVSVDDTLAGILTRPKIDLNGNGVEVSDFHKDNKEIKVTLLQKDKEEQGSLTMVFKAGSLDLLRMEVVDAIGKKTVVRFLNLTYNTSLGKEVFAFPRVKSNRRN